MAAVAINPNPNRNLDQNQDLERDLKNLGDKLTPPPSDVNDLINLLLLAENLLSKVDPGPSRSMSGAVFPVMKALVDKDLLYHKEIDVKTALASCFCEIMIIALPGCPYGHDFMKSIFQTIVDALKDLDDTSSHLYLKKASILETFTRVHSFLMMLDLEYDDLIIEMFQHFLKTTRPVNDVAVFSSMETIMTQLINESEDTLLSRLLESLVYDIKRKDPIAGRLVEKVIGNCAGKLDPYLNFFLQSNDTSRNEHCNIIASILQKKPDTLGSNLPSTAAECLESGKRRPSSLEQNPESYCDFGHSDIGPTARATELNGLCSSVVVNSDATIEYNIKKTWAGKENSLVQLKGTTSDFQRDVNKASMVPSSIRDCSNEADCSYGTGASECDQSHEVKMPLVNLSLKEADKTTTSTVYLEEEKEFETRARRPSRKVIEMKSLEQHQSQTKHLLAREDISKNNGRKRRRVSARKVPGMELSGRQQTKYEKLTGELRIIDDLSGELLEVL